VLPRAFGANREVAVATAASFYFLLVGTNVGTHAHHRLRWFCGLGLAAVGVE